MDAGTPRNPPAERFADHAQPGCPARVRRLLAALGLALLLFAGAGPGAAVLNANGFTVDASTAGPPGSAVDEQAVEVSATGVVRRRHAIGSIRRRLAVAVATVQTRMSRLLWTAMHLWTTPSRQLPPPPRRGPPAFAL